MKLKILDFSSALAYVNFDIASRQFSLITNICSKFQADKS